MNYRLWLNVLEKSPLEKLPTVVECFAKMNECFREIIPTGDVYKVNVHLPALKGIFWCLLEPLNVPKTLEIRYGRKKVQLSVKNKKHAPEGSTVF